MTHRDSQGRWLPGQSPNPGGRPKTLAEFRQLVRGWLPDIIEGLHRLAIEADRPDIRLKATSLILAYGLGRPPQASANDSDGQPMPDLSVFFPVRIDTADEDSTDDASGTR